MSEVTVADYIASFLVEKEIEHVFGFQGGAILKLLDAMIATGKIQYIQNYHEQASAFCADSYSRLNGKIGVALATSGPGATNLITGIANAQLDSVPALFITGQDYVGNVTRNNTARLNGFQDLNIVDVVKPITKYATAIYDEQRIRYELEKAYHFATNGRGGAVLLDIPIDIQFKMITPSQLESFSPEKEETPTFDLKEVFKLIIDSKRPVILAGGGVQLSGSSDLLQKLVHSLKIPVVSTLNGIDAFEGNFGFAGLHGNTFSNLAVQNADLLIVLGARLGQRQVGKKPNDYTTAKVIHVDIDTSELNRSLTEDISIQASLKEFLERMLGEVGQYKFPSFADWTKKIVQWKSEYSNTVCLNEEGIEPVKAVRLITQKLSDKAIMISDVGQNQMWVAQGFEKRGTQRLLNSSGLGSMGYSLPASIAARFLYPTDEVISFTGDGGLQMNIQELMVLGHLKLNIKCIVFNNNTLGMMREVQKRYYGGRYYGSNREEFACVNLEKISHAYGLNYLRIENLENIDSIDEALKKDGPWIIELNVQFDSKLSNRYDESEIFQTEKIE